MEKPTGFSIFSWNINGLRTIDINDTLEKLNCSLLGVQETKISRDQLDEEKAISRDFTSYFSFCRNRTGYSGVATYCKNDFMPNKAEEGLTNLLNAKYSRSADDLIGNYCNVTESEKSLATFGDEDGRCVITQHRVQTPDGHQKSLTVINVYCPRLRDDPEDTINNRQFKQTFHQILERRARSLVSAGSFVIIIGDFNIAHQVIDRCEGVETEAFTQDMFRIWLNDLFSKDFVDTFRKIHPTKREAYSCWCTKTNARQNNYGSRIDYIAVDKHLAEYLENAEIHPDVFGSDHCPISATFHSLIPIAGKKPPSGCTKYFLEFIGKQTKLSDFLNPNQSSTKFKSSAPETGTKISNSTNAKKRLAPTGGKQMDIKSFFVKKSKLGAANLAPKSQSDESNSDHSPKNETVEPCDSSVSVSPVEMQMNYMQTKSNPDAPKMWKMLMGTRDTPLCPGHNEPCSLRTVKKKGLNQGRKFWACSRGIGQSKDPNGNCNFFLWVNNKP